MFIFSEGVDPFADLRELPKSMEELTTHMSTVHATLEKKYLVSRDIAEFALDSDRSAEFFDYYKKEVLRTVDHINRTTGTCYKARVDPTRMAKGMELRRAHTGSPTPPPPATSSASPQATTSGTPPPADAQGDDEWIAAVNNTARKLAQQQAIERQRMQLAVEGNKENTPAAQKTFPRPDRTQYAQNGVSIAFSPYDSSTGGIDSNVKPARDQDNIFATPPMFRGFNGASPSH